MQLPSLPPHMASSARYLTALRYLFRSRPRAVRDTGVMYTGMLVSGAVQYVLAVLLARNLGAADFGIIVLATTISGFAAASTELATDAVGGLPLRLSRD